MHNFLRFFTLVLALLLAGCGATLPKVKPYKMDIQQGNVVTSEMLLKLRPGMTKSQVKFIMGTPLLIDSFRTNRWDYFYQLRKQGKIISQRRVILDFENDLLKRVRGDVVPKGKTVEDVTKQLETEAEGKAKTPVENEDAKGPIVVPLEEPAVKELEENAAEVAKEAEAALVPQEVVEDVAEETPASVLAVPVETAPAVSAKATAPVEMLKEEVPPVEAPKAEVVEEVAPVVADRPDTPSASEPLEQALVKEEMPVAEMATVQPNTKEVLTVMPASAEVNKLVFRLDRSLDTNRIIPNEVSESKAPLQDSVVKEVEETQEAAEEASLFERMLEKIGF